MQELTTTDKPANTGQRKYRTRGEPAGPVEVGKSWNREWGHVPAGVRLAWSDPHLLPLQKLLLGRGILPAFPQLSAVVMNGRAGTVNKMRTKALCISHLF